MKRYWVVFVSAILLVSVLSGCTAPTPVVIEKQVTQIVEKEKIVEKQVIQTQVVEKVTTATPLPPMAAPTKPPLVLESPMLAEQVKAGKLPPLDQRLPAKPLIVRDGTVSFKGAIPGFGLGNYGGLLRLTNFGSFDAVVFYGNIEPLMVGADIALENVYPNVLEDYKISPDFSTFTFTLRKGLKWSDGSPVTMDDVKFAFQDLYQNKDYGAPPGWLRSLDKERTPGTFSVIDDYNWQLKYNGARGALIKEMAMAGWQSYQAFIKPAKYLKAFHPKYADAVALKAEIEKAGLKPEQWPQLLATKDCSVYEVPAKKCIGFPSLTPWILTEYTDQGASWQRNPFYWKVDEGGRQLPYIDKIVSVSAADTETANVRVLGGDVDMAWYVDRQKAALFKEKGDQMGYDMSFQLNMHADGLSYQINGCTTDPVVKPLLNNVKFRQAMNYAMKRQEIIDNVFLGFGTVSNKVMPSEYSTAKASALLTEIGLTQKGSDGFLLSPDGKPFTILIEYGADYPLYGLAKGAELFAEHLKAVGIHAEARGSLGSVYAERVTANQVHVTVWETYSPTDADNLFPLMPGGQWCPSWNWTESSGKPRPADLPKEIERYVQIINERGKYPPRSPEDAKLFTEQYKLYNEQYWVLISFVDNKAGVWTSRKLGNLTKTGTGSGSWRALEVVYFK